MIHPGNLETEPALQFRQGKQSALLGVVSSFLVDAGEGGAGQQMNGTHGPDQAFNVPTEMGTPHGAMIETDAVLLAPSHKRVGMKFLCVADMNAFGQSTDWSFQMLHLSVGKPGDFGQHDMRQCKAQRNGGRSPQGEMKPGHHPSSDIDRRA